MTTDTLDSGNPELIELVSGWNEKLSEAGSSGAERAFGIGCGLALLPVLVVFALLLFLNVLNMILATILLVLALVLLVGIGMLTSYSARRTILDRVFREEIQPEIANYLAAHSLDRRQFDTLAAALLPTGSPLLHYLFPTIAVSASPAGGSDLHPE